MEKRFFGVLVLLVLLMAPVVVAAGEEGNPQFFNTLQDVPLMPGLVEMLDESVMFDKPGGRIAESAAASRALAVQEIEGFYRDTLPQLGWSPVGGNVYVRGGEKLRIALEEQNGYSVLYVSVAPQ